MARLRDRYKKEIVPQLRKDLSYGNVNQVPKVEKVVINMGLGEAIQNAKILDAAVQELTAISGQKPVVTKARKAIANFKLREGMSIGCMVTLRGTRMYEFLDRLVSLALPRVRDFRGVSDRSFDGRGNYSLGIREQIIFSEIDLDKIDKVRGVERFDRHLRQDRCGRQGAAQSAGNALSRLGEPVAKTCLRVKSERPQKFKVRQYNRCPLCGRPRAYFRRFRMCRLCLRDLALRGQIPGLRKASW